MRKNDSLYKTSKVCPNCYKIYKLILENFDEIEKKKIQEQNRRKKNGFSSGSNFYPGSSMTSFKKSRKGTISKKKPELLKVVEKSRMNDSKSFTTSNANANRFMLKSGNQVS